MVDKYISYTLPNGEYRYKNNKRKINLKVKGNDYIIKKDSVFANEMFSEDYYQSDKYKNATPYRKMSFQAARRIVDELIDNNDNACKGEEIDAVFHSLLTASFAVDGDINVCPSQIWEKIEENKD